MISKSLKQKSPNDVFFVGQVKTAMDSFKDSVDTTLTSKAEKVASAASESAEMIKKCK